MIGDRKILAVITARANSAGLPGKNYKALKGRPLVMWSVFAALKCEYVDKVYVSTNCPYVRSVVGDWLTVEKALGQRPRLHIVQRPEELATPQSKNEEALLHAVQVYENRNDHSPDIIVNLQPTSPIRNDNLLDRCIESMHNSDSDSLLTVNRHTPFFWRIKDNEAKPTYDPVQRPMRQDIKDEDWMYHDNGNVYMMTLQTLTEKLCRIGKNPFLYETTPYQSLQIDTEFDFQLIEKMSEIHGKMV